MERNQNDFTLDLLHNVNRRENHAWNVGYAESSRVNQGYIDTIVTSIDSQYAK